ncbi:MAG: SLBB domain-containing protein [Candidatus Eremiobacterota bacterium]
MKYRPWLWLLALLLLVSPPATAQTPTEEQQKNAARAPGIEPSRLQRVQLRRSVGTATGTDQSGQLLADKSADEEGPPDPLLAAVDPDRYRLAGGDQMEITIVSYENARFRRTVQPDGILVVGPVRLNVQGLRIREAEGRLRRELARYRRNFILNLSLVYVRRFPVQVIGEVNTPGIYQASGVTGAAEAVLDAGGLTKVGSMRRVQVLNKVTSRPIHTLDFLRWQQLGDQDQNPPLSPHQVVVVPALESEVQLSGQVQQPAIYEILTGETVRSLLRVAGGTTSVADLRQVQVGRLLPSGKRDTYRLNLDDPSAPDWNFALQNGDQIQVYDRSLAQGRVIVLGEVAGKEFFPKSVNQVTGLEEVQRRGVYRIQEGETAREVVLALGGPTAKADLEHAWVERTGPNGELLKIRVNLRRLLTQVPPGTNLSEPLVGDLALKDGDTLVIPPLPDSVFVVGHVFKPGPIPYNPSYGLREYIAMTGGTTEHAHTKHARLIRQVPGEPPLVWEFDLLDVMEEGAEPVVEMRPGDIVYVPLYRSFLQDYAPLLPSLLLIPQVFRN